jgi:hypothetical protein
MKFYETIKFQPYPFDMRQRPVFMKVYESRDSFVFPTWLIEISLSSAFRRFSL